MRWKLVVLPVLALFFLAAALPGRAQVTYAAEEGKQPFTVGSGVSNFSDDWGIQNPRQLGIAVWVDWRFPFVPPVLHGLGVEFEGRTLQWATPSYLPGHRMDTALGGPIYQWRRKGRIRPFGKYLLGIGSIDFPVPGSTYNHDTRVVFEPGAGADVRFWSRFSVRATYDYQFWHAIFGPNDLNPNGFTIGAVYDFGLRSSK
jgi:opacity protein-like surface antigen